MTWPMVVPMRWPAGVAMAWLMVVLWGMAPPTLLLLLLLLPAGAEMARVSCAAGTKVLCSTGVGTPPWPRPMVIFVGVSWGGGARPL